MARSRFPGGDQIILPQPHNGQIEVRNTSRRINVLCAGRRWRKTSLAMAIAVEAAAQNQRIVWGAPTYQQVFVGYEEALKAAGGVAKFVQSRMIADFPGGGRISFRSLDNPETGRGLTADGLIFDEAADIAETAWTEVLRPTLMDTEGWAWFIGTPKGLNWFYHLYEEAKRREDHNAWQIPSLGVEIIDEELVRTPHPYENPDLSFEEIQELFRTMSEEVFRQEILAQFVESSGAVFRNLDNVLTGVRSRPEYHTTHLKTQGIDWGRIRDFTVISTFCIDCMKELDLDRFQKISYPFQVQRVLYNYEKWRPAMITAESNSIGQPVLDSLEEHNLPIEPFMTTLQSKEEAVQSFVLTLERGEFELLDHEEGNLEMKAYTVKLTPTGRASYSAPKNGHDDIVMSRVLNWHGARNYTLVATHVASESRIMTMEQASQADQWSNLNKKDALDIIGEQLTQVMDRKAEGATRYQAALDAEVARLLELREVEMNKDIKEEQAVKLAKDLKKLTEEEALKLKNLEMKAFNEKRLEIQDA